MSLRYIFLLMKTRYSTYTMIATSTWQRTLAVNITVTKQFTSPLISQQHHHLHRHIARSEIDRHAQRRKERMIEKGEREREKWITVHSLSSSNSFTNCPNKWFFAIFESDNPKMMIFSEWDTTLYCLFSFLRQKEDIEVGICTRNRVEWRSHTGLSLQERWKIVMAEWKRRGVRRTLLQGLRIPT